MTDARKHLNVVRTKRHVAQVRYDRSTDPERRAELRAELDDYDAEIAELEALIGPPPTPPPLPYRRDVDD